MVQLFGGRLPKAGGRATRPIWMLIGGVIALFASTGVASAATTSAAVASVRHGGTLNVAQVGSFGAGLDPANPVNTPNVAEYYGVYDGLFTPSSNGTPIPDLATSYTTSKNKLTITINLRKHVSFQDGTPFNAAAAVFNLQRFQSTTQNSECVTYFQTITSITQKNNYAVQITFASPDPAFLSVISAEQCGLMVSPQAVATYGNQFGVNPVGTGPFKVTNVNPNVSVAMVRNPSYWQKGQPYLAAINFTVYAQDTAALQAVQAGTDQVMLGATPLDVVQARAARTLHVVKLPGTTIDYVTFAFNKAPFSNILARRAVVYATNGAAIVKGIDYGLYTTAESPIGPGSWAYSGKTIFGYPATNLAKAAADVKQIGGLSFTLQVMNTAPQEQLAAVLQSQWAAAGINVTIQPLQTPQFIGDLHSLNYQALLIVAPSSSIVDPDIILHRSYLSTSPLDQPGVKDPGLDKWILAGESTYDFAQRKYDYYRFNLEWAKIVPQDIFAANVNYDIDTPNVKGFNPNPAFINWAGVSIQ